MSIQGILNQQARDYLKLTSNYINELQTKDPTAAANARGMVDIAILQTYPAVKTEEQLAEFDAMMLQYLYYHDCDPRYDEEIHMGFKSVSRWLDGGGCILLSLRYNATTKPQPRTTMTPFGNYVRSKREEAGITLTEFAKRLKISPAYWSRIETGRENPPKDELIKEAAQILGVTEDDLFIEANRFPPDMQQDVAEAVRLYRKQHKNT